MKICSCFCFIVTKWMKSIKHVKKSRQYTILGSSYLKKRLHTQTALYFVQLRIYNSLFIIFIITELSFNVVNKISISLWHFSNWYWIGSQAYISIPICFLHLNPTFLMKHFSALPVIQNSLTHNALYTYP